MKISILKDKIKIDSIDNLISILFKNGYVHNETLFFDDDNFSDIISSNIIFLNYRNIEKTCSVVEIFDDRKYKGLIVITNSGFVSLTDQISDHHQDLNIVHSQNEKFIGITQKCHQKCHQRMVNMLSKLYQKYYGCRPSIVSSDHSEK